jgi:Domain of unknown function (DUF4189)
MDAGLCFLNFSQNREEDGHGGSRNSIADGRIGMRRLMAADSSAIAAMCAGVLLAVVAMSARLAEAQGFGYAAIAVSSSTNWSGAEKGTTTEASVENGALQYCQNKGARDCKIYAVVDGCVALAAPGKFIPNLYGVGKGATRQGAAAQALAECVKAGGISCAVSLAPCGSDDVRWPSPLPLPPGGSPGMVDPALVGLWKLTVNSGIWVWQIGADGTYTFHSEAPDNTQPHDGTFMTNNGHYTLHAVTVNWDDQGTYTMQGSTAVTMTGKLGTGTWYRIAIDPGYSGTPSGPASGPTIRR